MGPAILRDVPRIRFVFDFLSPYAYLGWVQVHTALGEDVEPVPVLFAALLDHHGQKGPAEIPAKRVYTWKHVLRLAADHAVTITPPPAHPFNPLTALRAVLAATADQRRAVIDTLFEATWGGGPGTGDPQTVTRVLEDAGLPGAELVAQTRDPAIKQRLKDNTEAMIAAGVFGVPSVLVDEEVFWGQDALPHVRRYLAGDDPVPADVLRAWDELPTAAVRPGSQTRSG